MRATLLVIPGSHPALTARLMFEHKGIPYRRIDLVPVVSRAIVRASGFPGSRVPALKLDGRRRVQGSREIARVLDEIRPHPPLFPPDPAERARVEEAERWGDEVLQPVARRMPWWAMRRDRSQAGTFIQGARLGVPTPVAERLLHPVILMAARLNAADEATVRADLEALPGLLDHVDGLIADGVIGGERPNAADFQIATSVRMLTLFDDFRAAVERRPAGALALRLVPHYPGRVPPVLRAEERHLVPGAA